jgi:hypothetical protein
MTESKGEGPRLLSGGNPQIPKDDGDAPVQAYIACRQERLQRAEATLDPLPFDDQAARAPTGGYAPPHERARHSGRGGVSRSNCPRPPDGADRRRLELT